MAEEYIDDNGVAHEVIRNENGYWVTISSPLPTVYTNTFTGTSNNGYLSFEQAGLSGDWFQLDNVYIRTGATTSDSYELLIRNYEDAVSTNAQVFNEITEFPNKLGDLLVPINEYLTHTSFNTVLGKMRENYEFLIDKSKFLSVPPNALSLRYGKVNSDKYPNDQNVWMQDDNLYYRNWDYSDTGAFYTDNVVATSDKMFYSYSENANGPTAPTIVAVDLSPENYNEDNIYLPEDTRSFYVFGEDEFTDILTMAIGDNENIWVLDKTADNLGKIGIFKHDGEWRFEDVWDVNSTEINRNFPAPTDMKIKDGLVYISCLIGITPTIKILTEIGSYVKSISHGLLNEPIDSISVTNNAIIALSDTKLYIFDHDSNLINTITFEEEDVQRYSPTRYTYDNVANITKLSDNTNGTFFYAIADNLIYKFGEDGTLLESFG